MQKQVLEGAKMEWQNLIEATISQNKDRLNNISKEIWSKPERSFNEVHAHDILTQFLAEEGFEVERNYTMSTGFRASFGATEGEGKVNKLQGQISWFWQVVSLHL